MQKEGTLAHHEVYLTPVGKEYSLNVSKPSQFVKEEDNYSDSEAVSSDSEIKPPRAENRFHLPTLSMDESYGNNTKGENFSSFVPLFTHCTDAARIGKTGDLKRVNMKELTAMVDSPTGMQQKGRIFENGEDSYSVRFRPKVIGVHSVNVMHHKEHIPGSPFQFNVGQPGSGAGKVTVSGQGLKAAAVNIPAEFDICTREAGSGGLSISLEGPSKGEINFEDKSEGLYASSYITTEPGEYKLSIKFNEEDIPGSPFNVIATGIGVGPSPSRLQMLRGSSDPSAVTTSGKGLNNATIGDKNTFIVDCSIAGSNMLMVGVHGPVSPCEDIVVKHIGNRRYVVSYAAPEPGEYSVIVKWGEDDIPGSPFHVEVS